MESTTELRKIWSTRKKQDGTLAVTSYKGKTGPEIVIPAKIGRAAVTEIGRGAFSSLIIYGRNETIREARDALTCVVIPEGVTIIGPGVFASCKNLTRVVIPEGVTVIGSSAFYTCKALKSVVIPASVQEIGGQAFHNCPNLTIYTPTGSCAAKFAQRTGIPFETAGASYLKGTW